MKTINTILNILAILFILAGLLGLGYLLYVVYVILDIFVDFYWWEFVIVGLIVAFTTWRVCKMWED